MLKLSLSKYYGISTVEFLFAAIPIFMIGLGSYETTRWYNTKHVLNLALVEASRQGALHHAKPASIETAFEKALKPLFSSALTSPSTRLTTYLKKTGIQLNDAPWRIIIENPRREHFIDFHRNDLPIAQQTGLLAIDNNYQQEQYQHKKIGVLSQSNIFQANTLTLSLTYPYEPIVPGLAYLFKQLNLFQHDHYSKNMMSKGFLPIRQTISISMQSHPVAWHTSLGQKIIWNHHNMENVTATHNLPEKCLGIWCRDIKIAQYNSAQEIPNLPTGNASINATHDTHHPPYQTLPKEHTPRYHEVEPSAPHHDNSLCGVSLCCQ